MVANVRIKGWVSGSAEIRTLFGFVIPYELLDDPLDGGKAADYNKNFLIIVGNVSLKKMGNSSKGSLPLVFWIHQPVHFRVKNAPFLTLLQQIKKTYFNCRVWSFLTPNYSLQKTCSIGF